MPNVLAPVDFSDATPGVLAAAAEMAEALGARLHVLHVDATDSIDIGYDVESNVGREELAKVLRAEHRALLDALDQVSGRGMAARGLMRRGDVVSTILGEAGRLEARLIVLGSHGHGALRQLLLGSVSTGVLRGAKSPVLIVPSHLPAGET